MNSIVQLILGSIAANTLILGILGFLFKTLFSQILSKDIASFKNKLESDSKVTLEGYKSELEKEKIRLQISYGGIFEKQAEAIINIYKLVLDFESKLEFALHAGNEEKALQESFVSSWRELRDFFEENRILLPREVDEHINKITKDTFWNVRRYRRLEDQLSRHTITPEEMDKLFEKQDKLLEIIDQLPSIKDELITKFRFLIGVQAPVK